MIMQSPISSSNQVKYANLGLIGVNEREDISDSESKSKIAGNDHYENANNHDIIKSHHKLLSSNKKVSRKEANAVSGIDWCPTQESTFSFDTADITRHDANKQEISVHHHFSCLQLSPEWRDLMLAWISMTLAVLSGSSIGPMFKYMYSNGVPPILAAAWRCQCMSIFLVPLALLEVASLRRAGIPPIDWLRRTPGSDLQYPIIVYVIIAGVVWAGNLLSWIIGLQYTTTVRASLFSSLHPLFLVAVIASGSCRAQIVSLCCAILRIAPSNASDNGIELELEGYAHPLDKKTTDAQIERDSMHSPIVSESHLHNNINDVASASGNNKPASVTVSRLEWLGVVIAVAGVFYAGSDALFETYHAANDSASRMTLIGDGFCISASIFEVWVILNRLVIKKHVPLMQYSASTTCIVSVLSTLFSMLLEDSKLLCGSSAMRDVHLVTHCVFGWTAGQWVGPILLFGLVVGVVCITGFNYAMQYISPLVFSAVTLLDPAITGIISWLVGLEGIPDSKTIIAGVFVVTGVGVITVGEHRREEQHKAHRQLQLPAQEQEQEQELGELPMTRKTAQLIDRLNLTTRKAISSFMIRTKTNRQGRSNTHVHSRSSSSYHMYNSRQNKYLHVGSEDDLDNGVI